jgi:hypothetical protein
MSGIIQWTPRTPDTFSIPVSELIRARKEAVQSTERQKTSTSEQEDAASPIYRAWDSMR